MLQDTADYIRPISFSLKFKINDTESGPVLDEGWPTTIKKSVSGHLPFHADFLWSPSDLLLHLHLCRSSSLKTAARTTCAPQTSCCRLTWTSPDRGPDKRRSSVRSSMTGSQRRLRFPPQAEAVCDSQPTSAPGGGGAASEQAGERLQHQPDAALFKEPALLQPQH